eukprot:TRINITY_DN7400_c0_g1_i1.p1 TRINITY_DN7400_c0_g1~~TRINITY_DN7400_c0_g1_i1.p1  ORF type:complete len:139 (+),score=3.02 TRINITY_DN7400_c0_g1_i1:266-682(+)
MTRLLAIVRLIRTGQGLGQRQVGAKGPVRPLAAQCIFVPLSGTPESWSWRWLEAYGPGFHLHRTLVNLFYAHQILSCQLLPQLFSFVLRSSHLPDRFSKVCRLDFRKSGRFILRSPSPPHLSGCCASPSLVLDSFFVS